jgi:hypothetical protein
MIPSHDFGQKKWIHRSKGDLAIIDLGFTCNPVPDRMSPGPSPEASTARESFRPICYSFSNSMRRHRGIITKAIYLRDTPILELIYN